MLTYLAIRELITSSEGDINQIRKHEGDIDPASETSQDIFEAILNAFNRRTSLNHGAFDGHFPSQSESDDAEAQPPEVGEKPAFVSAADTYIESEQSAADFEQLVEASCKQILKAINDPASHAAHGGYLVFAAYELVEQKHLLVALVRDKTGIAFNDALMPTEVIEVNLEQLHQAMRLNIASYLDGSDGYLSFIGTKSSGDLTHYFSKAFGCTEATPARQSTRALLQAARDFCSSKQLEDKKSEVVEEVVGYLEQQRSERQSATLNDIEKLFEPYVHADDEEGFSSFAQDAPYRVSKEFQSHRGTLTQMTRLALKDAQWQLNVNKQLLGLAGSGKAFEYDPSTQTLKIGRLSEGLIRQLQKALEE